ncbi:MAG: DUF4097 domain-containing protein [Acidobacteriota bacterium]|nr:DUF4097 domain-containing protein [Acidobacteriota bacterium]
MKLEVILISSVLVLLPAGLLAPADDHKGKVHTQRVERTVSADSSVTVSLCVKSGSITVRGWDKNQVLARSSDVSQIELKRADVPNQSGPATRLTVLMLDRAEGHRETNDCQAFGDVELMVPKGASVHVQTGDGAIDISAVASVYAKSQTGDIEVNGASQSVEALSFSSDVSVKNSSGRMSLRSVGGSVTARGLHPADSGDCFEASTISGEIELEGVSHSQISARTVNGEVHFTGPLAHGGHYTFNTTTGDVTLTLPSDASFRLNARVSQDAEITSDFPLTLKTETSIATPARRSGSIEYSAREVAPAKPARPATTPARPTITPARPATTDVPQPVVVNVEQSVKIKAKPIEIKVIYMSRRVTAVHGTGDASINVVSFSGSLHLEQN